MPFFKVCLTSEINLEKPKKFNVNGEDILIAKTADNIYLAFTNTCSHADKPLEKGKWNPETAEITCPFHKAVFAIAEHGAVKAPPAFVALTVYKVQIKQENDGEFIYVEME